MNTFPYTSECGESCELTLKPVPGAERYPLRLECKTHGYPTERRSNTIITGPEQDKPNIYASEIASPADVTVIGGNEVSTY